MKSTWLFVVACGGALAAGAGQHNDKKLTARELFYAAVDQPSAASPAPPSGAKSQKSAANPKLKPARSKSTSGTGNAVEASNRTPGPSASSGDTVRVMHASYSSRPLGLRYTLLKKAGNEEVEVDAETVFHAGDRIRLAVESNEDGHLYIVNRGSSGTWKLLFPAAEIKDGDNRIRGRARHEIPSGYTFTFDEQAGEEKLFVVLSRQPEQDLEKLIYSLGQGTAQPAAPEKPKVLMASAAFSDDVIGRLRNAYARDLIIEKVDDGEAGPRKEKAVYAVNPTGTADSRVVADITLKHQ